MEEKKEQKPEKIVPRVIEDEMKGSYLGYSMADFPVAYSLKDDILSLPIHGSMSDEQLDYVIAQVRLAVQA